MEMQERLKEFLKLEGLTPRAFEIKAGLSNGTCARLNETMRQATYDRIANTYPDLNMDWLLTGEGQMIAHVTPQERKERSQRLCQAFDYLQRRNLISSFKTFAHKWGWDFGVAKRLVSEYVDTLLSLSYYDNTSLADFDKAAGNIFNIEWLKSGRGEMLREPELESEFETEHSDEKEHTLPLLPIDVMAGNTTISLVGVKLEECEQYAVPDFIYHGAQMLIRVSGDSMTPRYNNGDIIALKEVPDISFFQWGKIYVLDTNQGALVKRLYEDKTNADNVICHSENSDMYHDFSMPKDSIRKLFIVIGVISIE